MERDHFNRLSDKLGMRIFRLAFFSQFSDGEPYVDGQSFLLSELQTLGHEPKRDLRTFQFPLHSASDIPRNITLVCRAWRTLSLQMHDLWAALALGPTAEDWDQGMLDEWLFRQNEEPIHLFVERQSNNVVSADPFHVFQFRHNAERLRSITFDLRSDLGDFQALQKTFADLQRLKPPSLTRFFIQCSNAYAPEKQAQPSYDLSPQAKPSDAVVSAVEAALLAFPNELLQSLEEYGVKLPVQYKAFLPSPQGSTRLRTLHIMLPLTPEEIISWLNHCPLLVGATFHLSYGDGGEVLPLAHIPSLRSLRIFHTTRGPQVPGPESIREPLRFLLDKLDITNNFREAHFETKSDRLNLVSTILAFLDSCLTRHVQIDTLSLHGESFKLHYPETSLSEGVYAALRQLRRLNVYQRFLGQKGIVSLMLEKSRASGELALPLLEELHVLEYHPSSPEDIAAFICSHSFTRAMHEESTSRGSLRRVVFSYSGTKKNSVPPIVANLAQWPDVVDCVRDGLSISVRLGSQLALFS